MEKHIDILDRDRTGKCTGECRDLILESMVKRQKDIKADPFKEPDSFPSADWARSRTEQPGWLGGHM